MARALMALLALFESFCDLTLKEGIYHLIDKEEEEYNRENCSYDFNYRGLLLLLRLFFGHRFLLCLKWENCQSLPLDVSM